MNAFQKAKFIFRIIFLVLLQLVIIMETSWAIIIPLRVEGWYYHDCQITTLAPLLELQKEEVLKVFRETQVRGISLEGEKNANMFPQKIQIHSHTETIIKLLPKVHSLIKKSGIQTVERISPFFNALIPVRRKF